MAKLYTYGSSPNCSSYSLFNDWNMPSEPFGNSEFGIVDPDPIELFEDLNDWPPSIFSDIKKIQSDSSATSGSIHNSDAGQCVDFFEPESKPEIRNIDCMWSAQPSQVLSGAAPTAANATSSAAVSAAVPLAAVIENAQNISNNKQQLQQQQRIAIVNKQPQYAAAAEVKLETIKSEPVDNDFEQQLQQHSIPNSRTALQHQHQHQQKLATSSLQHIKPGMSLLRKSNVQQQASRKQLPPNKFNGSIKIPAKTTAEFLRERDQTTTKNVACANTTTFGRPDTPLSLDDDPVAPEFKHNVDLRACVMGSNNISLVSSDPTNIINHLSEQLQDTTKNRIDLRNLLPENACDFADVLDLIVKDDGSRASTTLNTPNSSRTANNSAHHLNQHDFDSDDDDDDEDDDDYEDDIGSSCGSASGASQLSLSSLNRSLSSCTTSNTSATSAYASATSPLSSVGGSQPAYPIMMHSDHSYTRCNDDLGTNLETPSDSDEEIDVVSIGDKKLPTNPSDKDRRALQNKVAHKFSTARIVKTANGVRTIPPRRRITVELPYTPASSSPVKSVANSRYPSPSATPYQNQYTTKYVQQQSQHMLNVMGNTDGMITPTSGISEKQRKRMSGLVAAGGIANTAAGYIEYLPPSKKHRSSKKQKQHGMQVPEVADDIVKGHLSMDEAADTIEKRNLHNDMERQRRIGLKNLFEALKKQIPSIKDKERAPKVNILREAAKLCEALTREDQQLSEQKAILKEQLRKRQDLLARLRAEMQRD